MKRNFGVLFLVVICVYANAQNPIVQHPFTADPAPHQWSDGKYYLYCSHDKDNPGVWDMEDYHVYSSTDLVNWTDHGIALKNTDTPWDGPMWAPDAAEKDGMFYLYWPEGDHIGVARSKSPTGYFDDVKILYSGPDDAEYTYDPAIFQDDDGQYYMIVSSYMKTTKNFTPVLLKLGEDMMSVTEETILSIDGHFHEGPWLHKYKGQYYLSSGGAAAVYATSSNLKGPYIYQGIICDKWRDENGNIIPGEQQHPAIFQFNGQWYFASAWGRPDNKRRQVFMEYLYYNDDGTIQLIVPSMEGVVLPGIEKPVPSHRSAFGRIEAESFNSMSGVKTSNLSDGGSYIHSIDDKNHIMYQNVDFGSKAIGFEVRFANKAKQAGNIEIWLDDKDILASFSLDPTGGWESWEVKKFDIPNTKDTHDLQLRFSGKGSRLIILDWFKFIGGSTSGAPTGKSIWLKSVSNQEYIYTNSAIDPVTKPLYANKKTIDKASRYLLGEAGGGNVTLFDINSSTFIVAEQNNAERSINCDRNVAGEWEKFGWKINDDKTLSLYSSASNRYVTVTESGLLVANSLDIGDAQKFFWGISE